MSSKEGGNDSSPGEDSGGGGGGSSCGSDSPASSSSAAAEKRKEKVRVSRTSLILWHTHQNDVIAVKKLLAEDRALVAARDYDIRTPLHVAALHGWTEVAKCLLDCGADVNAQDRWKNTPLADAEGAKKHGMIELLKSYGGLSYGQTSSHFETKPVPPPLPNKCDWEIDPTELDFTASSIIGKGSFGEILRANWRGTPVAVKRILPSLSDDRLVMGMAYLHNEPNVIIHRDLKPRNVLLVNSNADHLKVGDFGLSKLIKVQNSHDVYKLTGETGSYRYMAPEVFKHRKYDKKVDVFSFAMIVYEVRTHLLSSVLFEMDIILR